MKNSKFFVLIILCIGSTLLSSGQGLYDVPTNVIPPGPNSAGLGKFLEAPVSISTGIPEIGVPIYTISEGGISIPISLSYYAGGIRVEEIASWIGLGWNLNAGGSVSRTTRGLPDDVFNGYIYTDKTVEYIRSLESMVRYQQFQAYSRGERDFEPDIFNFNFPGYSGRFYYNQESEEFMETPFSNVVFTPKYDLNDEIEGWVFTTPEGFKYYFGVSKDNARSGVEENSGSNHYSYSNGLMAYSEASDTPDHITTWHLMDIISPSGRKVSFTYQDAGETVQYVKGEESMLFPECQSSDYSVSFTRVINYEKLISKIEFENGKVEFVMDPSARQDLSGGNALRSIKIFKGDSLFKEFVLTHSYFTSNSGSEDWGTFGDYAQRLKRLKLDTIYERSSEMEVMPPYTFEYNTTALPSRFSNAQDYWGFYNGMNDNESLVPVTCLNELAGLYLGNADRTVDNTAAMAGILKKITYPTGGSAEYFYENNIASQIWSSADLSFNLRNRLNPQLESFMNAPVYVDSSENYAYIRQFTLGERIEGQTNFTTSVTGCDNSGSLANYLCDYFMEVRGISDTTVNFGITSSDMDVNLDPGIYEISATIGGGDPPVDPGFSVTIRWGEETFPPQDSSGKYVGGVRAYKTKLNDGYGHSIEKAYEYNTFGTSSSSGYVVTAPVFLDPEFYNGSCNPDQDVYKVTSLSQAPGVNVNGNILGYSNVSEYINDTIKTEYTFDIRGDIAQYQSVTHLYVILPDVYSNWLRGNLIEKKELRYNGSSYDTVSITKNEYEVYGADSVANFGLKIVPTISGNVNLFTNKYGYYSAFSEWHRIKSSISTSYFGDKNVETATIYCYNSNPKFPSQTMTINNQLDTLTQTLYYPFDVTSATSLGTTDTLTQAEFNAIDSLKTVTSQSARGQNRISSPIQIISKKKDGPNPDILLNTERVLFKDLGMNYNNSGRLIQPSMKLSSIGVAALETDVTYHEFDSFGNPTEISDRTGVHIVFLWGLNSIYPVAKIINATETVVEAIFTTTELSNLRGDYYIGNDAGLMTLLNKLRSSSTLSESQIVTYTYDALLGMTSETDPNGRTTYYEYDSFGRLAYRPG